MKKRRGYDTFEGMYGGNPIIFSAVNSICESLFSYRKEKHFEIVCSSSDLRRFFSDILLEGQFDGLYGQAYDLEGFLREVLQSLLIFGRAFYKIDWTNRDYEEYGTRWVVERIRWLAVETMDFVKDNGQIRGFKQEYSNHCSYQDVRGKKVEFEPDEVFFVEWVFDGGENRGVPPLRRLIQPSKEMDRFLKTVELSVYAIGHPIPRSFPSNTGPSVKVTVILSTFSITWLLVRM